MTNTRFASLMISIPVTFGLLLALVADAGAADTTRTTRKLADGRTEVCTYESEWVTTRDGSHVKRTAWRCITPPASRK